MDKLQSKDGSFIEVNLAELSHNAEECECVHMCLDREGVPRKENGDALSLWGRVVRYAKSQRKES